MCLLPQEMAKVPEDRKWDIRFLYTGAVWEAPGEEESSLQWEMHGDLDLEDIRKQNFFLFISICIFIVFILFLKQDLTLSLRLA